MRNKHIFKGTMLCRCPKEACGNLFTKKVVIEYITNQRGDIIEHRTIQ